MSLISKSTNKTALAVSSYGTKIRNHNSPTEVPVLKPKSSIPGTKKFQRWNNFWNSYILQIAYDTTKPSIRKSYEPYVPTTHYTSPLNLLPTEEMGNLQ